jgi:enoyl-CoA hydratase
MESALVRYDRDRTVAVIELLPLSKTLVDAADPDDIHIRLGVTLRSLHGEPGLRAVVLTGAEDGEFLVTPATSHYSSGAADSRLGGAEAGWRVARGVIDTHLAIAQLPVPVIARVNGNAIGFGQSLLLASDLIVAREDAVVSDVHLSLGLPAGNNKGESVGPPFAVAPGDGAGVLAPLYMAPPIAKEYLMLSRALTARELADRHLINYAVPAGQLDATVNEVIDGVLARSSQSIAWTKQMVNQHVISRLNSGVDLGMAFELLSFQLSRDPAS